jgi:hypothetical protein
VTRTHHPRGFLHVGAVVGWYTPWGPHGGARENRQHELLLRAARLPSQWTEGVRYFGEGLDVRALVAPIK